MTTFEFPKGFLWGSATSAHQVEGNNKNSDWYAWEQAGGGAEPSDIACDSYNRYEEDFTIAKNLNHNAHRLSVEWARIEPNENEFDLKEIEHYKKVLKSLKEKGIKTFVTLHHFTNPIWFSQKGGWTNIKSPELFCKYAEYCFKELEGLVDFWITINEPSVYFYNSFTVGEWPPCQKNIFNSLKVYVNMARAHKLFYRTVDKSSNPQIGFSINIPSFDAFRKDPWDMAAAYILNKLFVEPFMFLCKGTFTFIGLNYYFRQYLKNLKPIFKYDLGHVEFQNWSIDPEGLYLVLKHLNQYKKPIYITENGCADKHDTVRTKFIKFHLRYLHKAINEGVDVRGYLYWSLLDNFEWAYGFEPRFGLVEIDRNQNLARKIRPSALEFSDIIKNNKLVLDQNV